MYQGLLSAIILPSAWDTRGNIPALARLLNAIIPRYVQGIMDKNLIEPILGIFQKLLAMRTHEALAIELIETIITNIPLAALENYFVDIVRLMLMRLSNMKTETFQQRFIAFYHFISARQEKGLGADFFITVSDQVQQEYVSIKDRKSVV